GESMPAIRSGWLLLLVALAVTMSLPPVPRAVAAEDETASIKGIVTLNGKPVQDGRVFFHLGDGQFVGAKVKDDGAFRVDRVPAGAHTVTVEGRGVPAKYTSEEQSAIRVTVERGANSVNIDLKSR